MGTAASDVRGLLQRKWAELASHVVGPGSLATVDLYLPVAAGHLRVAVDGQGQRHLLLPFAGDVDVQVDTSSGGVHLLPRPLVVADAVVQFADLHCLAPALNDVFLSFCTSLVELVLAKPDLTPQQLHELLMAWRDLLSGRPRGWSRAGVAGFFGEVLVMERALTSDSAAAASWRGPYREPQDFRSASAAIEVKASTSEQARVVSVHGVDQLLAPPGGTLWLGWMRLAVVGGSAGRSVDEVLAACATLAEDPAVLAAAVDVSRWSQAPQELRDLRFEAREERWYAVTPGFPRLTSAELSGGAVPNGVTRVSYEVNLDVLPDPGPDWAQGVRDLVDAL